MERTSVVITLSREVAGLPTALRARSVRSLKTMRGPVCPTPSHSAVEMQEEAMCDAPGAAQTERCDEGKNWIMRAPNDVKASRPIWFEERQRTDGGT